MRCDLISTFSDSILKQAYSSGINNAFLELLSTTMPNKKTFRRNYIIKLRKRTGKTCSKTKVMDSANFQQG